MAYFLKAQCKQYIDKKKKLQQYNFYIRDKGERTHNIPIAFLVKNT